MRFKRRASLLLAVCIATVMTACNHTDSASQSQVSGTDSSTAVASGTQTTSDSGTAPTDELSSSQSGQASRSSSTSTRSGATSSTLSGKSNNPNLVVWATHSLDRVRKNRKAQSTTDTTLYAAKGEYESFQVVANSKKGYITLQDLVVSDFKGASGTISAKDNVTVFREHYVAVDKNSPVRGNTVVPEPTGMIADALIPVKNPETGARLTNNRFNAFPYELDPADCQPFWIDVFVPRTAKAGTYTATYTMDTNGGVQTGKITLKVWNIELPKVQAQKTCFGSWTERTSMKAREAAKNRIFMTGLDAGMEKELQSKYGYNISSVPFWSGADLSNATMREPPSVQDVKAAAAEHMSGLPLYCYSADEIGGVPSLYAPLIRWGQTMHKAGVQHLVVMPPVEALFDDGLGTGRSAVDIWVVLPFQYDASRAVIDKARNKGDSIWTYNCMVQDSYSPKWLLDYALINFRIHPGFINYSQDVDGFLFWTTDNWKSVKDPWEALDVNTEGYIWNGDGILFYPGDDVGLYDSYVPSLRVKAVRDGLEDYELCKAIEAKGKKAMASSYSKAIGSSFSEWTQDAKVLIQKRIDMGNSI